MSLDLTDDTNLRAFSEKFLTELMSRRRLQPGAMLETSVYRIVNSSD